MLFLDLTLPTPAENLACDEALLEWCETEQAEEVLRIWESPVPFVVLGYGNKTADEVDLQAVRRNHLPVLRRISGGGSVLQGPGCLNYSLILRIPSDPSHPFQSITETNRSITRRHAQALSPLLGPDVHERGLSDITIGQLKFSGNAQRRKRHYLLFHGTVLRDFDLPLIDASLEVPRRQPEYRRNRPHREFLVNTSLSPETVAAQLRKTWQASLPLADPPWQRIARLAKERYADEKWSFLL